MKLVYHHRIRSKDGQYVHVAELVKALRRQKTEVKIVGPKSTKNAAFGDDGGGVGKLKSALPQWLYELLELGYGLYATVRLWRKVRRHRPDALYERYNLHTPAGAIVSRWFGIPLILEINAPIAEERAKHDGLALPGLARMIEGWIWRAADRVIVVTAVLGDRVTARGVDPARMAVMANGIDPRLYQDPSEPSHDRPTITLGFVGFVRAWHGLDAVIDWLAAINRPDIQLVIAGDGPHATALKERAARSGVTDQVRHLGLVGREQVPTLLHGFDIALQPAAVDYASPLKLIEYMAAGLAIVAPDQANIREVVRDHETGLLFQEGEMTRALERLIDDPELRARLGANAKAAIEIRGLTWDHNADKVRDLIRQCSPEGADVSLRQSSKIES